MRSSLSRPHVAAVTAVSAVLSFALACSGGDEGGGGTRPDEARVHGLTAEEREAPVARIGDRVVTAGEFAEIIASKGPFLSVRYNAPERRRELLDQLVRFELLANEAEARGYDELPEVTRSRKQLVIRRFLKREYEDAFSASDVSDADVAAYYEEHNGEFNKPEQIRVSQIVVATEAEATRLLRQLLAEPTNVRLFRALAEEHDTDPATMDRFGDLGFFSRPEERQAGEPDVPPEVANAAFTIATIGGIYPEVVHTSRGYHVLKLTGRRAALHRTLEEATTPIRNRINRERREAAIDELLERLRAEADVSEDLSLLDTIHIDEAPASTGVLVEDPVGGTIPAPPETVPGGSVPGGSVPGGSVPGGSVPGGSGTRPPLPGGVTPG